MVNLPFVTWGLCVVVSSCTQSQEVLTRATNLRPEREAGPQPSPDAAAAQTDAEASRTTHESERDTVDSRKDASAESPQPAADAPVVVGAGYYSTCASVVGKLYCWGDNSFGQLAVEGATSLSRPTRVAVDFKAAFIDGGERHMCALDTRGSVYCWGANDAGQLAQGDRRDQYAPMRVQLPDAARTLTSGANHACALTEQAHLYCWGANQKGQSAGGEAIAGDTQGTVDLLTPVRLGDGVWSAVSAGRDHTCGIQTEGSLWCWGRNQERQGGQPEGEWHRSPTRVGPDQDWKFVVAGQVHSCGIRGDHSLWCWGSNIEATPYPLGADWPERQASPTLVSNLTWRTVHTRGLSTCGFTHDGDALCWGRNEEGQLGLKDVKRRVSPTFVARGGLQIATGLLHTCGVSEGSDVYCTGNNTSGELGLGDLERRTEFTRVRF